MALELSYLTSLAIQSNKLSNFPDWISMPIHQSNGHWDGKVRLTINNIFYSLRSRHACTVASAESSRGRDGAGEKCVCVIRQASGSGGKRSVRPKHQSGVSWRAVRRRGKEPGSNAPRRCGSIGAWLVHENDHDGRLTRRHGSTADTSDQFMSKYRERHPEQLLHSRRVQTLIVNDAIFEVSSINCPF